MITALQLDLFELPPIEGAERIMGVVRKEGNVFVAEIVGGWWIGHGYTKDAAIKNAILAYNSEIEAYNE